MSSPLSVVYSQRIAFLEKRCPHRPCFVGVYAGGCFLIANADKVIKTPAFMGKKNEKRFLG